MSGAAAVLEVGSDSQEFGSCQMTGLKSTSHETKDWSKAYVLKTGPWVETTYV